MLACILFFISFLFLFFFKLVLVAAFISYLLEAFFEVTQPLFGLGSSTRLSDCVPFSHSVASSEGGDGVERKGREGTLWRGFYGKRRALYLPPPHPPPPEYQLILKVSISGQEEKN